MRERIATRKLRGRRDSVAKSPPALPIGILKKILDTKERIANRRRIRWATASLGQKEKWREASRRTLENPAIRIRSLIQQAIKRAKRKGWICAPTASLHRHIMRGGHPTHCACCKQRFDYSTGKGRGHLNNPLSPSIDRLDNLEGYSTQNMRVICYRCNMLKGDGKLPEFQNIVRYMRRRTRSLKTPGPAKRAYMLPSGSKLESTTRVS